MLNVIITSEVSDRKGSYVKKKNKIKQRKKSAFAIVFIKKLNIYNIT